MAVQESSCVSGVVTAAAARTGREARWLAAAMATPRLGDQAKNAATASAQNANVNTPSPTARRPSGEDQNSECIVTS
jgi:hypothetical protein